MAERGPRTENRKIGERYYVVTQMPPSRALPLQFRLGALIIPAIPALAGLESKGTESVIIQALGTIAGQLTEQMTGQEFHDLAKDLLQDSGYVLAGDTAGDVAPIIFEQEFMGDAMAQLYPVLSFVLEVNYAKFFTGLMGSRLGGALRTALPSKS